MTGTILTIDPSALRKGDSVMVIGFDAAAQGSVKGNRGRGQRKSLFSLFFCSNTKLIVKELNFEQL